MTDSGFIVPNEADASYTDQAEIDAGDWRNVAGIGQGTGVISGCAVTQQGSPDDTVAVAAGVYAIRGIPVTCAGGNVNVLSGSANADGTTSSAANASYFRYDLIVGNISGQLGVLHGTVPAPTYPDYIVNPVFPDFDRSTHAVLAALFLPPTAAALTGVQTGMIIRKDVDVSAGAFVAPHFKHTLPTGAIGQTIDRTAPMGNLASIIQTGVLYLASIYLPRGIATSASWRSATTAAAVPTAWFFALYDSSLVLVRQTADQTTTAWAANTTKTVNFSTPYTVTTAGLYYLGISMTATTVVSLLGVARGSAQDAAGTAAPILHGTSTASLTGTAPNPAAAITISGVGRPWGYVS